MVVTLISNENDQNIIDSRGNNACTRQEIEQRRFDASVKIQSLARTIHAMYFLEQLRADAVATALKKQKVFVDAFFWIVWFSGSLNLALLSYET